MPCKSAILKLSMVMPVVILLSVSLMRDCDGYNQGAGYVLAPSSRWIDGDYTNDKLDGTSCITADYSGSGSLLGNYSGDQ